MVNDCSLIVAHRLSGKCLPLAGKPALNIRAIDGRSCSHSHQKDCNYSCDQGCWNTPKMVNACVSICFRILYGLIIDSADGIQNVLIRHYKNASLSKMDRSLCRCLCNIIFTLLCEKPNCAAIAEIGSRYQ